MAAKSPSADSLGQKMASLIEVQSVYNRMKTLIELDNELNMKRAELAADPVKWNQLWDSEYKDVIEKLERNDAFFSEEGDFEKDLSFDKEMNEDEFLECGENLVKKTDSITIAMEKQLSLLDKEKTLRNNRAIYFEKFFDLETERNDILSQQAVMSVEIKDLLQTEVKSQQVLDRDHEQSRRIMMTDMAKWLDCLLYNMSMELREEMQNEQIGKWSEIYLKWCLWMDLKDGVVDDDDSATVPQTN